MRLECECRMRRMAWSNTGQTSEYGSRRLFTDGSILEISVEGEEHRRMGKTQNSFAARVGYRRKIYVHWAFSLASHILAHEHTTIYHD